MREFDDNPHSYAPVLRRIAILVAVIVMVPAMLWTITSFMRTYVAQPVIASPKPLLMPATTASINTPNASTSTATDSGASSQPTAPIITANDSNAPSPTAKVASLATSDMPPSVTPGTAPQPAGNSPSADSPSANGPSANSPSANSPWPDPSQAIGGQTAGAQMSPTDTSPATATNDDALPPTPPLTGKIPLPPRRPTVLAMTATGAVPLPRARPADAGTPAETPTETGSNFFHLFGQSH